MLWNCLQITIIYLFKIVSVSLNMVSGVSACSLTSNGFQNQSFFSWNEINLTLCMTVKHTNASVLCYTGAFLSYALWTSFIYSFLIECFIKQQVFFRYQRLFTSHVCSLLKLLVSVYLWSSWKADLQPSRSELLPPFGSACSRYNCCLEVWLKASCVCACRGVLCNSIIWALLPLLLAGTMSHHSLKKRISQYRQGCLSWKESTAPPDFLNYFRTESLVWLFHSKDAAILQRSVGTVHDTCPKPDNMWKFTTQGFARYGNINLRIEKCSGGILFNDSCLKFSKLEMLQKSWKSDALCGVD